MPTRRTFLHLSAAVGTAALGATIPGLRALAQPLPQRRSLHDMDLDDPVLATLRDFVAQMKDPSRDGQPISWVAFADVHGSLADGFNLCPHGNWYFLPWHRGYIRMYEVAARDLTGNADFAMPYWDWTAHRDFPAAFGDETFDGAPNPLFVPGRQMVTGDMLDEAVSGQSVLDSILDKLTFEEFGSSRPSGQGSTDPMWVMRRGVQGELEFNPHNNIHCDIAGPFMCSGASPQDPIFQMHHGNIDRIWAEWIAQGRADASDPLWLDMAFTDNFIAPDGTTYTDVVRDLLVPEDLGYTYQTPPSGPPSGPPPVSYPGRDLYLLSLYGAPALLETGFAAGRPTARSGPVTALPGDPADVTLEGGRLGAARAVSPLATDALEAAGLPPRNVYAFLRDVRPDRGDVTQLRVFVNAPGANADTPTEGNPNFVTAIGFFGPVLGAEGSGPSAAVDLTPALRRLSDANALESDDITVQLVPVAQSEGVEPTAVAIAEVELAVV